MEEKEKERRERERERVRERERKKIVSHTQTALPNTSSWRWTTVLNMREKGMKH